MPIAPSDRSSSGFWNGRTLRLASELRPDVVLMDRAMLVGSARSFLSSLLPPPWWLLALALGTATPVWAQADRKSTRLNSSHLVISYAVFCLKKKKKNTLESHH